MGNTPGEDAYQLASEGVRRLVSVATSSSAVERERLQAANQPKIAALEMKRERLVRRHRHLSRQIQSLGIRSATESASASDLLLAACFALFGFVLARKTIEPFGLGNTGELFALGLALLAPYAVERFLRRFHRRVVVAALLDIVVFLIALGTMVAFAEIRADVFRHEMDGGAAVVLDTTMQALPEAPIESEPVADLLRWAMILAALGSELACGLCWHDYLEGRRRTNAGLLRQVSKKIEKTEKELLSVMKELQQLLAAPGLAYATFWTGFQQGVSDAMARVGQNTRVAAIVLVALLACQAVRAQSLHLMVAVDLSQTANEQGATEGSSEFEENVQAVARLLGNLPAGSRVTVIGITDASLTRPYTLLSAEVSADTGYFGSRLTAARRSMVAVWHARSKDLEPTAPHTDIIGALLYSSQILARSQATRKAIALLSDMRNEAGGLDLERPQVINLKKTLGYVNQGSLVAALPGVEVFVLGAGAHSTAKDLRYFRSLEAFWKEYFQRAKAILRIFSPGREGDALRMVTAGGK